MFFLIILTLISKNLCLHKTEGKLIKRQISVEVYRLSTIKRYFPVCFLSKIRFPLKINRMKLAFQLRFFYYVIFLLRQYFVTFQLNTRVEMKKACLINTSPSSVLIFSIYLIIYNIFFLLLLRICIRKKDSLK